jgi:pyruvate dehydrogenase E2 component (dihydrolipoamide acetyltransferase)
MYSQQNKKIKLNMLRKAMIKNLEKSINVASQSTVTIEIDMSNLVFVKNILSKRLLKKEKEMKLSYLPLLIYIISRALARHPFLNSKLDSSGNEIIIEKDINIGFAVAVKRRDLPGILLPVIRNADKKKLSELILIIKELAKKATMGNISSKEMSGGTFSISSVGRYQIDFIQPLLNYPEGAILGITRIKEKPIVKEGKIQISPISNFCITVDHRIIDGVSTYRFLEDLKKTIEEIELKNID